MTSLREAAQQALEALMDDCLMKVGPHSWERRSDLAITALRAALAEYDKDRVKVEEMKANWALQRKLAEETQERDKQQREYEEQRLAELAEPVQGCPSCEYNKQRAQLWRHEAYKAGGHPLDWEPELMARPKPLTEEEIKRIDDSTHFHESPDWSLRFARAIERAHGIGEKE